MTDYIDKKYLGLLERHHLHAFDALWSLDLERVDVPNTGRGGWSTVFRLTLADESGVNKTFFIKRQCNYLCRPWHHPLGEPTFAREFRNIRTYETFGLPTAGVVYFAQRKSPEGPKAILITRALENYLPLNRFLGSWKDLDAGDRRFILTEIGSLIGRLHRCGLTHRSLFPKHIFIGLKQEVPVRLIDLEQARTRWLRKRDFVSEMTEILGRVALWSSEERHLIIQYYLMENPIFSSIEQFLGLVELRIARKAARP
ncbi:MAG: lipopolysaccharide kinase InaA family protein [Gammaproteobacteria bacterium]|nr:lipopolysaccharide kinase InaA family protein [Gammaproteobacteria bacterium]NNJ85312.1 lipopolysaccharide kinase [Gammaproteobacteria bacterium]